jgi:hypothetical protein
LPIAAGYDDLGAGSPPAVAARNTPGPRTATRSAAQHQLPRRHRHLLRPGAGWLVFLATIPQAGTRETARSGHSPAGSIGRRGSARPATGSIRTGRQHRASWAWVSGVRVLPSAGGTRTGKPPPAPPGPPAGRDSGTATGYRQAVCAFRRSKAAAMRQLGQSLRNVWPSPRASTWQPWACSLSSSAATRSPSGGGRRPRLRHCRDTPAVGVPGQRADVLAVWAVPTQHDANQVAFCVAIVPAARRFAALPTEGLNGRRSGRPGRVAPAATVALGTTSTRSRAAPRLAVTARAVFAGYRSRQRQP